MRTPFKRWHYKCQSAAALALYLALSASTDAQIYKWIDASGTVHYSQAPPPDGNFSEVPVIVPQPRTADESQRQLQDLINHQKETEDREAKDKSDASALAAKQVKRADMCIKARDELTKLQETPSHRLMVKKNDGEVSRMSDEERQDRIEDMQRAIVENCD